jgi:poly-gamma-glutamate capsule biosynthesis protein CapA/YwtB (metallophosphatase superfamily)
MPEPDIMNSVLQITTLIAFKKETIMYISRSKKKRATRKVKNSYFNKTWMLLIILLVSVILIVLCYAWMTRDNKSVSSADVIKVDHLSEIDVLKVVDLPEVVPETAVVVEPVVVVDPVVTVKPVVSVEPEVVIQPDDSSNIVVNSDSILTFNFAGDMMFAGKVEAKLKEKGYDYPFKHLGKLFLNDDLTIANLETPITTSGIGAANKQFVFKSSPKALDALKKTGMDAVGLANNHILDQGVSGLLDTIKYLEKTGIQYAGAGKNADEAYAPEYFTRQGVKIALIAVSRVVPHEDWYAGKGKPGVAQAYNPALALKSIATARKKADIVIVMAHWGKERDLRPIKNQTELAHQFVDAGADLVIGAHPHVLQGLEQYKGKWIAYSTGNFIFTKSSTTSTWKTAIFATTCTPKGECKIKLIPYHAEIGQPVPMSSKDGQQLFKEIEKLSIGGVKIKKDGTVIMPQP